MDFWYILLYAFVIFVIFYFFIFLPPKIKKNKIKSNPLYTRDGKIVEKYMTVVPLPRSSKSVPHISFEATDGQRMAFELTNEQYGLIQEGDKGTLSYREYKSVNYFDSFKRKV